MLYFPKLPGLTWNVVEKPMTSTRVVKHVSGRSVRASLYANPLYSFELGYSILNSSSSANAPGGTASLQVLEGFFLGQSGQAQPFLFRKSDASQDLADSYVSGQLLGTGDGSNRTFIFTRSIGTLWTEPVGHIETAGLQVYVAGSLVASSGYSVTQPNTLTFSSAPANGAAVTASYSWDHLCCFDEASLDFAEFMFQLHECKSVKFSSYRP